MNFLNKTCLRQIRHYTGTSVNISPKFNAEPLSNRALIRIQGNEVAPFLQGLVTNDMNQLARDKHSAIFTMFLNNSGRVLYDAMIYRTAADDTYLIECDREVSNELRRHLRLYRVKKKIAIDCVSADYTPWVVYNPNENDYHPEPDQASNPKPTEILCAPDPRLKELGCRVVQPKGHYLKDLSLLFSDAELVRSADGYFPLRHRYGVGEGAVDHPPGKCFPLEANCDLLNGVSFNKGCYVGQELTARVHHTGVIRKRLMPVELSAKIDDKVNKVQTQAGTVIGTLRSISDKRALALLRVEPVLNAQKLMIDGDYCNAYKPYWWPQTISQRQSRSSE